MSRRGKRAGRWAGLALAAALVGGCGGCGGEAGGPRGERGSSTAGVAVEGTFPDAPVILISIDTLRSDRLPLYGYGAGETPHLDAFGEDAVRFESAWSHYPLTLPSHASVFTGLLPPEHGVRDNLGYRLDGEAHETLASRFAAAGRPTGGAVSALVLEAPTGISAGFDLWDDDLTVRRAMGLSDAQRSGDDTRLRLERWIARLEEAEGESGSFLAFFHLYEPHSPYTPPEPFASRFEDPYDGEVAAADAIVGRFLDFLRQRGLYDDALIVVFSDHGEGLGDHGEAEHGILLYREALQVPLLVKLPGGEAAGAVVETPVQLADIAPTVYDLAGLERPEALEGRPSLTEVLAGEVPDRGLYAETWYPRLHLGWNELTSLVEGSYHYIEGPDPELYDLDGDPGQTENILSRERRTYARMRDRLAELQVPLEAPGRVDPEAAEKLAALGYLSAPSLGSEGPLPDPKTMVVTVLGRLEEARERMAREDWSEAVGILDELRRESPDLLEVWKSLGQCYLRLDRLPEAVEAYEEALRLSGPEPRLVVRLASLYHDLGRSQDALDLLGTTWEGGMDHPSVGKQLGIVLADLGRTREALAILEPLARGDGTGDGAERDAELLNALAVAQVQAGRPGEAKRLLEGLLRDDPEDPKALETLGSVLLTEGRAAEARQLLERSVRLDDRLALAWNSLGVARQLEGDTAAALEAWRRAVDLDPQLFDALYNLGLTAAASGRPRIAREALGRYLETAPADTYPAERQRARQILERL